MGTWGTGPLENDSAQDCLDLVRSVTGEARAAMIESIFSRVISSPEIIARDVFPDEVIAYAAIVAASISGSEIYPWAGTPEISEAVLPAAAATAIASAAHQAIEISLVGASSWWSRSWVDDSDRESAALAIREIRGVLQSVS